MGVSEELDVLGLLRLDMSRGLGNRLSGFLTASNRGFGHDKITEDGARKQDSRLS